MQPQSLFVRGNETVRDLPHVLVRRIVERDSTGNTLTYYHKRFKLNGWNIWSDRENRFLMRFMSDKLRHVVQTKKFDSSTPGVIDVVETHDAGLTIEEWLQVTPRYADGTTFSHPFRRGEEFIRLLRACLAALQEIHAAGVVHCDIKQDNICITCTPYPCQTNRLLQPDLSSIRLIDFSFSLSKTLPLQQTLPIEPSADYQSPLLKQALAADNKGGKPEEVNKLDYRVDLYGLGYMGKQIINNGKLIWDRDSAARGVAGESLIRAMLDELIVLGTERKGWFNLRGNGLPHLRMIQTLDAWLKDAEAPEAFMPVSQGQDRAQPMPLMTPVTPVISRIFDAQPVREADNNPGRNSPPGEKISPARFSPAPIGSTGINATVKTVLMVAGAFFLLKAGYSWFIEHPESPPPQISAVTPEPVADPVPVSSPVVPVREAPPAPPIAAAPTAQIQTAPPPVAAPAPVQPPSHH